MTMNKYKYIVVPRYTFKDKLGTFIIPNVKLLVPAETDEQLFNPDTDNYEISGDEIERIYCLALAQGPKTNKK